MPFPLENFEEELSNIYAQLDRVLIKIKAAQNNPINQTPARSKRLKSLHYKAKTCSKLIKEISEKSSELWY